MANKSNKSKSNNKLINGVDAVGHVARNGLERFGSLLDSINAKSGKASQFKSVDLSQYNSRNTNNLLSKQTLKTSEQLLGSRFTTYSKYAKKVVPDSIVQKASDGVFSQVAKLAGTWSKIDLPSDQRFDGIQNLTDHERNNLARDIANQNRALATIGGVTGLAGLPGMLADTLWLLLVSLRTVYQLATVYDKPLTGKQGVKMAYAVLGNADLSKMQEKQTILAALGVAKGLADSAGSTSLRNEISNGVGVANPSIKFYAEQVDKLAEQFDFDIDNLNLSWLSKFLPLASVATTVHYNSHLIDQVIGVAKATFGPEPVTAKQSLTDKSDEADQSNGSETENESKKDSKNEQSEVKEEVEDQFGEEPAEPTKGAETQESYEFNTESDESSNQASDSEQDQAASEKTDAKSDEKNK